MKTRTNFKTIVHIREENKRKREKELLIDQIIKTSRQNLTITKIDSFLIITTELYILDIKHTTMDDIQINIRHNIESISSSSKISKSEINRIIYKLVEEEEMHTYLQKIFTSFLSKNVYSEKQQQLLDFKKQIIKLPYHILLNLYHELKQTIKITLKHDLQHITKEINMVRELLTQSFQGLACKSIRKTLLIALEDKTTQKETICKTAKASIKLSDEELIELFERK